MTALTGKIQRLCKQGWLVKTPTIRVCKSHLIYEKQDSVIKGGTSFFHWNTWFSKKGKEKNKLGNVLWSPPKWDTLGAEPRLSDSLLHPRPKTEPVHSRPASKTALPSRGLYRAYSFF